MLVYTKLVKCTIGLDSIFNRSSKLILTAMLFLQCFFFSARAQTHIPNANFAAFIRTQCPTCIDGSNNLTAAAATLTNVSPIGQSISDLTGIDGFINVTYINCSNNPLGTLPKFPASLQTLYCYNSGLTSIPSSSLPSGLQYIDCSNNSLTSLPTLPPTLGGLTCYINNITCLPTLPATLRNLYLDASKITCLPNAVSGLNVYNYGSNSPTVFPVCTIATPTASATQSTCSLPTGTVTITSPLGTGITYSLDGGTATSSTSFSGVAPGVHSVVAYGNCATSTAASVTVNALYPNQATIYVDINVTAGANNGTSWANAYTDLNAALNAARACSTITEIDVAKGTYIGGFSMVRGVKIMGGFPTGGGSRNYINNVTILSGNNSQGVIDNSTNSLTSSAVLDGFTISGGRKNGSAGFGNGAGMYNLNGSSPTLTNVIFSNNNANSGGGMYNGSSCSPTLTNVTFSSNTILGDGGGMYNGISSSPTLTNVTFSGNSATNGGGMHNSRTSSPTLTNVTFSNNNATNGGGMYNYSSSSPMLANVIFSNNTTTNQGGGMYNSTSSPTLTNVTFTGNSAASGGGIFNQNSLPTLINVTFTGNSASLGGGLSNNGSQSPILTNCILWGDIGGEIDNFFSTPTVTYSDVQGGYSGTGNINLDPKFVSSTDLSLQQCSPAINAGTNTGAPTTDILGNPRPFNNGVADMGAYEYQGNPVSAPTAISPQNFCGSATVANLTATGTGIQWYISSTGGSALATSTSLVSGTTYYASQTVSGCESTARTAVTVTVNPLPTISGTLTVCVGSTTTLTGSGIVSYSSSNPSVATVTLQGVSGVVTGISAGTSVITYTNNNGCKSTTTVTVNALPTISGTLTVCVGSTTTLTGSGIVMYSSSNTSVATVFLQAVSGVVTGVSAGTSVITYTNNNGCKSTATVTVNALPTAPTATSPQTFCGSATVTNLSATGTGIQWYAASSGGSALATSTSLVSGTTYYASQTLSGCESTARTAVTVTIYPSQPIIYVDINASGANNGTSWANAFTDLKAALNAARTCNTIKEIDVAKGTYIGGFSMVEGVKILGGFPTGGGSRNYIINVTILRGNNSQKVINNDNNGLTSASVLDGFTVSGGNANGFGGGMYNFSSSPTLTNVTFSGNSASFAGGGMGNFNCSPTLTNVTFSGNTAQNNGGGMYNSQSSPTLTKVTFSGNTATLQNGGGIFNQYSSSPTLTNVTFSGNSAAGGGGISNENSSPTLTNVTFSGNTDGMTNLFSSPTLTNCILWGDALGEITDQGGNTSNVTYSDVQGGFAGTGNINADPIFVSSTNLSLQQCSPAINVGTNSGAPTTDILGNPRPYNNGITDMGAYEYQGNGGIQQAPTATSPQTFCSGATVASLTANGTGIKWYTVSTGGTALASTAPLTSGTYYASQTVSGCESTARTAVMVTFNVPTAITTQPLTAAQLGCPNFPATLLSVTATGTGTLSYQWFSNGIAISGATGNTYTPPTNQVGTTNYYCIATGNCGFATSNASGAVTVNPPPAITTQPSTAAQSGCPNFTASGLSVTATGTGTLSYQWYMTYGPSISGGIQITGATSSTYTPATNQVGTLYYYCVVTGSCGSATSNVSGGVKVNNFSIAIGSQPFNIDQTFCPNQGSAFIYSVSAYGSSISYTYQWYSNTTRSNTGGSPIAGATSNNYQPSISTVGTTYYYCVVTGDCGSATSDVSGAVTVNAPTAITTQPSTAAQSGCPNFTASGLSVTATGTGSLSYQWYLNPGPINSGGIQIAGATGSTYTPATNQVGTMYYFCEVTGTCGTVRSNVSGGVTVNNFSIAIGSQPFNIDQTFCPNQGSAFIYSVSAYGTSISYTYQWYSNTTRTNTGGSPIAGATSNNYQPSISTVGTTYYYCVVTGDCGSATSDVSGAVTVNPPTAITTQPSTAAQSGCPNFTASGLSVTATGTGPLSYQWYMAYGPSISGGIQIAGATSSTYTPATNQVGTLYYYCVVTGVCGSATSNVSGGVKVNNFSIAVGSQPFNIDQTFCPNQGSAFIYSVSAYGTSISYTYQWYSNTTRTNTGGSPIAGATSNNYQPSISTVGTTYYYCVVTGDCGSATSDVSGAVTVNPPTAITTQPSMAAQSGCPNFTASGLSVTATGTGPLSYQWYMAYGPSISGGIQIAGATSSMYTPATSQMGTFYYYCVVTGVCGSATSNVSGSVTVKDVTPPVQPTLTDVTAECSATPTAPTTTDNCAGTVTGTTSTVFPITKQGTTIVTWTFADGNGNSTTATQNVVIKDVTAPVKPTLADVTAECSATPTAPTTTDNCAGTVTGTTTTVFPITTQGTTVVTWTFADGNGNSTTATQNVIIKDVTPPVKPTLADVTAECSVAGIDAPTTTDNCAGTVTGTTTTTFPITTQGTTVVTWTFADGNGNSTTATQNVIIKDVTPPVKPTLADVTAECSAIPTAPITTDNCAGTVTGTTTTTFPITTQGTTVVTWTFADGNGNSTTATQNVIIKDVTAPVKPTLADVSAECSAIPATPTTTDNCAGTVTGTTTTVFPITTQGTTVVTWTFGDGNGNSSTATQNVIIKDVTPPVKPTLANVTAECSVASIAAPTTTDNCAGTLTGTTSTVFPITNQGTTVVTWTFADGNGNSTTATQNVIIKDITPPVKPTLANVTAECSVASIAAPTTTDNCAGTVTGTTTTTFPITTQGTTVVTWTFADGNGNSTTATQNVIIKDVTPPVKPTLADVTAECSVAGIDAPTTTDNCAGTVTGTTTTVFPITTQGTTVVTWTFADGNGNSTTATQNVIIKDVTPPVKPTLANVTAECSVASIAAPTTTDNCAGTVTGTNTTTFPITTQGTTVVTWTFADGNGNSTTATQNVIIKDVTPPVKPTLADVTAECSVAGIVAPTTTDNCAGTVTGTTTTTFPITTQGTTVVTWTFADGNGNSTTATQNVIIKDVTQPVKPTLANVTAECSVASIAAPTTTDNCAGTLTGTTTKTFPITTQGTTVVTWTFADGNGNSTTATQNVIIKDVTPPVKPTLANVTAECSVASIAAPTTTDNCAGTLTGTTTTTFPITTQGTTVVIWTFADGNGNSSTATQNVIIKDVTPPVKPTLANVTAECSVASIGAPTTTDNCAGTVTGTTTATFPITTQGTTVVTWTFADGNGNSTTATQNVIIKDVTPPVKPTLANITAECSVASIAAPTTTDNCAGTLTGTTTTTFPITTQGTTVVTWTFADGNGNSTTATQNVIIKDVTPPVKPTLANITAECSVASIAAPTTTDNCAGTVTGTTTTVFPITTQGTTVVTWTFADGNGNSTTATQNVIIKDVTPPVKPTLANVTAECSVASIAAPTTTDNCKGTVTGTTSTVFPITTQGTTVVAWTFADGNGNSTTANQNVIIKDVTPPVKPTLANVTVECSVASITAPTTTDNCAGNVTGTTTTTFPITTQGTTVVTWTFADGNGNSTTATQNVIIKDVTPPVKPTLTNVTAECSVASITAPTTTDNCKGTVTGTTTTVFPITTQGTTVVTWTFADGNGNSTTATQNVIIKDVTPPVKPTLTNVTAECSVASIAAPTTTDNCKGTVTGTTSTVFPITTQGTTVVTWTFADGNGNSTIATQNVIIKDVTKPVITCPEAIIKNSDVGICGAKASFNAATATDNCSGTPTIKLTSSLVSGSTFPVGLTTVSYSATDAVGNISTCTFTITINSLSSFNAALCYKIINKKSGLAITFDGNKAYQAERGEIDIPSVNFVATTNGSVKIATTSNSNKVFSNVSGLIKLQNYNATSSDWKINCSNGYYIITQSSTGQLLTVNNKVSDDETPISVAIANGTDNQLWQLVVVTCKSGESDDFSSSHSSDIKTYGSGTENAKSNLDFTVLPNPAKGEATLIINQTENLEVHLEVINTLGKTMFSDVIQTASSSTYQLDLSNYASGLYFIKLQTPDNQILTQKLQVTK